MSSDKEDDDEDDEKEEEVVCVGTQKSPLKDATNVGGAGWTRDLEISLVMVVGEKEAHIPEKGAVKAKWEEVMEEFAIRTKKTYKRYRTLKDVYESLLKESAKKDPNNDSTMTDKDAELWTLLEDHRVEIEREKAKTDKKAKRMKDSDAQLAREGKEERDVASAAMIQRRVTLLGGKKWTFEGDKVVAEKDDGSTFNITFEELKGNVDKDTSSNRGGTAAQALTALAAVRERIEDKKNEILRQEMDRRKEKIEQRHREAQMLQSKQQFELQMKQLQVQQMTMMAQFAKSSGGAAFPLNMLNIMYVKANIKKSAKVY